MMTSHPSTAVSPSDADLVQRSLAGGRSAFGEIVSRYQTLICSLTYNGTGSLSRSEDVAQEVFVTAWKELRQLREPSKLRPWLCGIARRLTANMRRRDLRQPVHAAEELDAGHCSSAPDPSEQTISREEEAILWRSLDQIPEAYREPLILFYREDQSIESVALSLELTEDAAKQRLSRGRKMLQEQVAKFVEGALRQTTPGRAFTLGVMAALPLMTTSASAATLGATAAKGTTAAKAAGVIGMLGILVGPVVGCLGAWFGVKASLLSAQSERERQCIRRQSRIMLGLVLGAILVFALGYPVAEYFWSSHPRAGVLTLAFFPVAYVVVLLAMIVRFNRERLRIRREESHHAGPEFAAEHARAWKTYEYRSPWTFFGLPLVHVRTGRPMGEKLRPALGWIAIGDLAIGLMACGGLSIGGISIGGLSLGLLSLGGFAAGAVAYGGFALGFGAAGGLAVGYFAFGGTALGWRAATGGFAVAHDYAVGGQAIAAHANDQTAHAMLKSLAFFPFAQKLMLWASAFIWLPIILVIFQAKRAMLVMRGKPEAR
jgi:RNA polymerase sigma factor (sigma-70 family)